MSKYTIIDLFSGAGGLSYGFEMAGCEVKLAIEKDAWAVETYKANHKNQNVFELDITTLPDDYFLSYKGKIDIVMGGPPCQGFSIAASNRRKKDDSRNTLYQHFLRAVALIEPKAVLIENVKEIVGYKLPDGTKIVEDAMVVSSRRPSGMSRAIGNHSIYTQGTSTGLGRSSLSMLRSRGSMSRTSPECASPLTLALNWS